MRKAAEELTLILDFSASLSVGLIDDQGRTLAYRLKDQGARGETAHALLDECLAESGRSIRNLSGICVGVGPGSFTGIRVCAAMAQGLAFAERLPLYPFSSLAGILSGAGGTPRDVPGVPAIDPAASAATRSHGPSIDAITAIAAIAANGGRYFVRWPRPAVAGEAGPAFQEALLSADALQALGSRETILITSGNFPDRERMGPAFAALKRHEDTADFPALARLARSAPPVTDGVLRPNYLQVSAAEEKRRSGEAPG